MSVPQGRVRLSRVRYQGQVKEKERERESVSVSVCERERERERERESVSVCVTPCWLVGGVQPSVQVQAASCHCPPLIWFPHLTGLV
jgi:hypothetical protein